MNSHLHAHVLGLDHHHYTQRIERLLNAFLNLQRHALLHLKPVREDVYHTGNLAQPRDVAVRNISHVRFAIERQHVVLAQGEEINILHNHHLTVFFLELGRTQHFMRVHRITLGQGQHSLGHTFRCLQQSFTLHIFTQQGKDTLVVFLQLIQCRRLYFFFS